MLRCLNMLANTEKNRYNSYLQSVKKGIEYLCYLTIYLIKQFYTNTNSLCKIIHCETKKNKCFYKKYVFYLTLLKQNVTSRLDIFVYHKYTFLINVQCGCIKCNAIR